jgi:hypothetical protein
MSRQSSGNPNDNRGFDKHGSLSNVGPSSSGGSSGGNRDLRGGSSG